METLETAVDGHTFWITLRRPPLNILDVALLGAMEAALGPLRERPDVKVVGLRSALPGTFSAGSDVKDHTRERAPEMLRVFHSLIRTLHELPQSTLAVVDGLCLGGGCELALVCDVVLATPRSTFGQPEIDLGCFPPVAAAWLPRLAGRAAFEMVLGGQPVDASRAAALGLITRVADDAAGAAAAWTQLLGGKSSAALALARRALRAGLDGPFTDALRGAESLYVHALLPTRDATEGVAAFLEKRKPEWSNR